MIGTCSSLSPIFLNFKTNAPTILMNFSVMLVKMVNYAFFQQKIETTFPKNKTRNPKHILCGTNTWNSFPNNLKSATYVNSFNHHINPLLCNIVEWLDTL